jgi:putative aldouronate transport system permease protein
MFIILSLTCLIPVLLVLSISLSNETQIAIHGYKLVPQGFTIGSYRYVIGGSATILKAYGVTIFVTLVGTFLHLFITGMLAYTISNKNVKYGNIIAFFVFFTMLFGGGIVPSYILITKYLHLKDTIAILILPLLVSPMNTLILKNFFKTIPESLAEAARIDGSTEFKTFLKIILPLSTPALATIGLFTAIGYWNDWYTCSLYIRDTSKFTLQYLLQSVMNNLSYLQSTPEAQRMASKTIGALPSESARMAICILVVWPIVLVYPFLQKYFVKGLTLGAVKS